MSDQQREIGFESAGDKFQPKKTLYDKILENKQKVGNVQNVQNVQNVENGDNVGNVGNGDNVGNVENEQNVKSVGNGENLGNVGNGENVKNVQNVGNEQNVKRGGRRRTLGVVMGVMIVLMVGVIGFLVYTLMMEREEAEEMRVTLEMQKENLTNELNELYAQYDSLQTNNDSMNVLIAERQEQIRSLLAIRASNAKKIQIYEEQVTSLRQVLRSYIVQVDSLNQANLRLQAENRAAHDQIRQATQANQQLERNIRSLEQTVEKASVVKALFVQAEPIEDNGNLARRLNRVDKIKVSFALAENPVAKKGLKRIYVRIANPGMITMTKNISNVFEAEGETIPFSAFREVEYEGTQLDVAIYYDAEKEEIIEGTYYVDLYMDGEMIGTTTFSLK